MGKNNCSVINDIADTKKKFYNDATAAMAVKILFTDYLNAF